MKKHSTELLSPAGTPESAWAALAYGADAIYAGLAQFSARADAGNFSAEAFNELVGYAHHLGRHVYVTFNTLVQEAELNDALETLATLRDLNVDGVIVQDMGVVRLIRRHVPELRLHASTQLAVHNLAGAKQLAGLGFERIVLARELSLKEIEHITKHCGIETEVFVHGALCYSYSGLCLFSSHLIGRSGNRGRCAYCCRQPFTDEDGKTGLPFSMKDFSAAEHLPRILDAGVASLKIEGRMKSPLYVAAVTDFYRSMVDGQLDRQERARRLTDIQTIFGRPSTDLYLADANTDPIEPVNAGHHGAKIGTVKQIRPGGWLIFISNRALQKHDGLKISSPGDTFAYGFAANDLRFPNEPESKRRFELPAGKEIAVRMPPGAPKVDVGSMIYCSYSQEVRQRYEFSVPRDGQYRQHRPVSVRVVQGKDETVLTASADGVDVSVTLPGPFDEARQPEKTAAAFQRCFEKTGETDWQLDDLTFDGPAVFIPVSQLNEARRRLLDELSLKWKQSRRDFGPLENFVENPPRPADAGHPSRGGDPKQSPPREGFDWSVKVRKFQPLEQIDSLDELVLEIDLQHPDEIEKALTALPIEKLRLALPVIIREEDADAFSTLIKRYPQIEKWEAANVGGLHLLTGKPDVTADWSLYTLNTQAALQWQEQGVSRFVLSPEDDAANLDALLGQLGGAAMVPVYQHTPLMISASRPAAFGSDLADRKNLQFHLEQTGREFVLTGDKPFSLVSRLDELKAYGARRFRVDLLYGSDDADEIISRIFSGSPVPGETGNYDRRLL